MLEAEDVKAFGKEAEIDYGYFNDLVNEAKDKINEYGDFEWFVSDEPYDAPPFKGAKVTKGE